LNQYRARLGRIIDDLRRGRHREAYALFLIGIVLVVLGFVNVVGAQPLLSVILLALSFLVFHTSADQPSLPPVLDQVLCNRQDFGPFSKLLPGVNDLRIYGPTAVNALVAAADIRRFVLDLGGTARFIVQDSESDLIASTAVQLDDNLDFKQTLLSSEAILRRLAVHPGFDYRKLSVNPGFSLVIVNAGAADGYVIFESQGFKDENIADRMHVVIKRQDSPHWFFYWIERFDAMWDNSVPTAPAAAKQDSQGQNPN
jgi:hypothetical protein